MIEDSNSTLNKNIKSTITNMGPEMNDISFQESEVKH